MDSIFSAIAIEKLVGFHQGIVGERNYPQEKFDVIVYDGISSDETLRTIGAAERARWYLKYLRNMAEKTDLGRLTSPSIIKLADESLRLYSGSQVNGRSSAEIWDDIDKILENITAAYAKPTKFSCYLMMDPSNPATVTSALRFWGCAIQAGVMISGAFGFASQSSRASSDVAKNKISPLPFALMPYISTHSSVDWDETLKFLGKDAHNLLTASSYIQSSVKFNPAEKSVNLFMPGFDKSEIKLYQYRGGSELLVEAGDQRRVVRLPPNMQGKVVGAKFIERSTRHWLYTPHMRVGMRDATWAFVQWLEKATIEEDYILMAEPDHVFVNPLPNLARGDYPAGFPFFYIKPAEHEKIVRKFYPEEKGPVTNVDPIGNSPVIIKKSQLEKIATTWMNVSLRMKDDPETDKAFGWVLEMYAYAVASALHGVQHILRKDFMIQPPWDLDVGKRFIIHYTYGCDYNLKGELTYGKIGEWRFDKRSYLRGPPPKDLSLPPPGVPESVVTLVKMVNEATANIPGWDDGR